MIAVATGVAAVIAPIVPTIAVAIPAMMLATVAIPAVVVPVIVVVRVAPVVMVAVMLVALVMVALMLAPMMMSAMATLLGHGLRAERHSNGSRNDTGDDAADHDFPSLEVDEGETALIGKVAGDQDIRGPEL